jgi:Protein of unknown function (DUF664)
MADLDDQGRTDPPARGDELETLCGFLDYQRETFEWKTSGLDAAGFATAVPPSPMTLGGLTKHLAFVEDYWLSYRLCSNEQSEPWSGADWDADPDWEWHSARDDEPDALRALWRRFVDQSRANVADALSDGDLTQLAQRRREGHEPPSLRWMLCHMIEEYARHNGHADYLREAVDGQTGE